MGKHGITLGTVVGLLWIAVGAGAREYITVPGSPGSSGAMLTFAGRVVDDNGTPISGAVVKVRPWTPAQGYTGAPVASVKTDWRGWYTVRVPESDFPNGHLGIDAEKPGDTYAGWGVGFPPGLPATQLTLPIIPEVCHVGIPSARCEELARVGCPAPGSPDMPNLCNPNWPPAQAPQPLQGLPPNWFHLSLDPFGFAGTRNAATQVPDLGADGGPFGSSSGGQSR